ncbi:hypothetical protein Syun_000543 [Stephania yunnanensis]|uniref:Uncharacterized protein n=1 Tax=Stephania yunnanensis TaxID=152371 RepID=A0AAP0LC66_9MAGN
MSLISPWLLSSRWPSSALKAPRAAPSLTTRCLVGPSALHSSRRFVGASPSPVVHTYSAHPFAIPHGRLLHRSPPSSSCIVCHGLGFVESGVGRVLKEGRGKRTNRRIADRDERRRKKEGSRRRFGESGRRRRDDPVVRQNNGDGRRMRDLKRRRGRSSGGAAEEKRRSGRVEVGSRRRRRRRYV